MARDAPIATSQLRFERKYDRETLDEQFEPVEFFGHSNNQGTVTDPTACQPEFPAPLFRAAR